MGEPPIIETAESTEIPDDGRIMLGEEYAHRRVPVEINTPADEDESRTTHDAEYIFHSVRKYDADSRGRITIPADVREKYDELLYIVSQQAYKHGSVGEAYENQRDNEANE